MKHVENMHKLTVHERWNHFKSLVVEPGFFFDYGNNTLRFS